MKRLIMTMVMAAVMSMTVSAQRIDNTIKEARILADKMVEEVNLNNWQREKANTLFHRTISHNNYLVQ